MITNIKCQCVRQCQSLLSFGVRICIVTAHLNARAPLLEYDDLKQQNQHKKSEEIRIICKLSTHTENDD